MEKVPTQLKIHVIRGCRVMLDHDLAELYGVPAKRLNEQVKRNAFRFPSDFMFQLTYQEVAGLRSQFATLDGRGKYSKYLPYAFTEQGVAMLSSVLSSERAVLVNIEIMRAFVRYREITNEDKILTTRIDLLELQSEIHDQKLTDVFEAIEQLISTSKTPRRKIGFKWD